MRIYYNYYLKWIYNGPQFPSNSMYLTENGLKNHIANKKQTQQPNTFFYKAAVPHTIPLLERVYLNLHIQYILAYLYNNSLHTLVKTTN